MKQTALTYFQGPQNHPIVQPQAVSGVQQPSTAAGNPPLTKTPQEQAVLLMADLKDRQRWSMVAQQRLKATQAKYAEAQASSETNPADLIKLAKDIADLSVYITKANANVQLVRQQLMLLTSGFPVLPTQLGLRPGVPQVTNTTDAVQNSTGSATDPLLSKSGLQPGTVPQKGSVAGTSSASSLQQPNPSMASSTGSTTAGSEILKLVQGRQPGIQPTSKAGQSEESTPSLLSSQPLSGADSLSSTATHGRPGHSKATSLESCIDDVTFGSFPPQETDLSVPEAGSSGLSPDLDDFATAGKALSKENMDFWLSPGSNVPPSLSSFPSGLPEDYDTDSEGDVDQPVADSIFATEDEEQRRGLNIGSRSKEKNFDSGSGGGLAAAVDQIARQSTGASVNADPLASTASLFNSDSSWPSASAGSVIKPRKGGPPPGLSAQGPEHSKAAGTSQKWFGVSQGQPSNSSNGRHSKGGPSTNSKPSVSGNNGDGSSKPQQERDRLGNPSAKSAWGSALEDLIGGSAESSEEQTARAGKSSSSRQDERLGIPSDTSVSSARSSTTTGTASQSNNWPSTSSVWGTDLLQLSHLTESSWPSAQKANGHVRAAPQKPWAKAGEDIDLSQATVSTDDEDDDDAKDRRDSRVEGPERTDQDGESAEDGDDKDDSSSPWMLVEHMPHQVSVTFKQQAMIA